MHVHVLTFGLKGLIFKNVTLLWLNVQKYLIYVQKIK